MRKKPTIVFLSILILACAGGVRASEPTVARLANGLEVVLIENHGSPMIAATMVVRAGADLETGPSSGASHMMEHLLFNGTERRTQRELYDETDLYGIYNNATTRRFHTDYFVLASKDRIREAMDIQEDMLFHSIFPEEKFEKERGIVLEELGKDIQEPSYVADLLFRAAVFQMTPYARPVLGTRSSIETMSRDDVVRYHAATYVPGNMLLLVMGDFETDSMLRLVDEIYGKAKPGSAPKRVAYRPPRPMGRVYSQFHVDSDRGFLHVVFDAPAGNDPEALLFDVAVDFIGNRLDTKLAEADDPLLLSAGASYERRENWGRLVLTAEFDDELGPEEAEKAILAELEKLLGEGPSPDEVDRFRTSTKTGEIFLAEKPHMYGMMKAPAFARNGYGEVEGYLDALDRLEPDHLTGNLNRAINRGLRFVVACLPGEPDYTDKDMETVVPGEIAVWERKGGDPATGGGEAVAVIRTPKEDGGAAGESRSAVFDTTLANGMRLRVESNDDSPVFAIHLLARHRSWQEPEGQAGIADLLHRSLLKGAGDLDGNGQNAALERIGAQAKVCDASFIPFDNYYTVPSYSFVRFTTIDENARAGVDLFADMILEPRLAENDVESLKKEMLMFAGRRAGKPSDHSRLLLARSLYGDHPLAADPEGSAGTIGAITADDVARFRDLYFAPDNLVATVFTSLPAREVAAMLIERFGEEERFGRRKPAPPLPEPTTTDALVEDELGQAQGYIRIGYVASVPEEDRAALRIAVSILSDRIAFDLRETRGLAYVIGAGVSFLEGTATIVAAMGTAPDNFGEAIPGMKEHFDRFGSIETIEPEELEKAVNSILGRMNMRRLSRPNQAYRSGLALFTGDGEGGGDELRAVRPEDVVRVANLYVRSSPAAAVLVR